MEQINLTINQNATISPLFSKLPNEPFFVFLSMNIIQMLFSLIGIIAALVFIFTTLCHRSVHTLSNVLTCNSSLAVLILASDVFSIAVYILYRDLSPKRVEMHNMFLCHLRAYISHVSFCALVHSFVIQAFYRLVGIIYYDRLYFQSLRPYLYAIVVQWTIAIVQILPIAVTNNQVFIEEEYLCQIAINNTRAILYVCTVVYFIPLPLILIQYLIITKYSRRKNNGTQTINIQQRARRQMKLIRRILILMTILLVLGTPYCTIIVLDTISLVPASPYAHRIGFLFIGIASGCIMLMMIYFTRNIRRLLNGKGKNRKKHPLKSKTNQLHTGNTLKRFREIVQSETIAGDQPLI